MLAYDEMGVPAGNLAKQLAEWVLASRGRTFCNRFDLANRLSWRMPISVSQYKDTDLYLIKDVGRPVGEQPNQIVIGRPERIFRYSRGVAWRVHKLAGKYLIDQVPIENGDVVIDCGANVGEVGLHVRSRTEARVIAIEPSELEARACDENLFGGQPHTQRCALWNSVGEKTFYDSNATADSSLISPASPHAGVTTVTTRRLDDLVEEFGVETIKLLKIEAEGAEPEILEGSKQTLKNVSHCVIDCGPERGPENQHVIPQVCNFMFGSGFELRDVNLERQIYWFSNRKANQ